MKNAYGFGLGVLVVLFVGGSAEATQFYVRPDGNDACSGLANSAGSSGACAFRTIAKCESLARCGDTCNVGAGEFFEKQGMTIADACTPTSKKRIVGAGPNATTVYFGFVGALTCVKRTGSTFVYECNVPSGAVTDSSTLDPKRCFLQTLGTARIDLEPKAGRAQSYRHSICLTPARSETSIDSDDNDIADATLDSLAGEGFWVHTPGSSKYYIHPFGHLPPGPAVRFFPGDATATGGDFVFFDRAKYATVEGMKVIGGRVYAANYNLGIEIRNLVVYHAGLWVGLDTTGANQSDGMIIENAKFLQMIRRIRDKGCGLLGNPCSTTTDFSSPQACVVRGKNTIVDGLECYSGNEGLSFGGEGHQIKNTVSHGFYNHGCKINERYENSKFENLVCYNNQEGMHWAGCQKNILFKHVTIDGSVMIQGQGNPETACADGSATGQWNVDFFNSVLSKISYNDPYGMDPRAGARGFDNDYNVYFRSGGFITHNRPAPDPDTAFTTMAAWQSYSGDTCTNCTRDPHSIWVEKTAIFQNSSGNDLDSSLADYDLRTGSPAFEFGSPTYNTGDGKDFDRVTRANRPDAGAFEFGGTSGAVCGNGAIEGAEQCEGTNLNGSTCELLGLGTGTLLCSSTCAFNTSDCVGNVPPPPTDVRRDDVRP